MLTFIFSLQCIVIFTISFFLLLYVKIVFFVGKTSKKWENAQENLSKKNQKLTNGIYYCDWKIHIFFLICGHYIAYFWNNRRLKQYNGIIHFWLILRARDIHFWLFLSFIRGIGTVKAVISKSLNLESWGTGSLVPSPNYFWNRKNTNYKTLQRVSLDYTFSNLKFLIFKNELKKI